MAGSILFPVICVVSLSVISHAQPPFAHHGPPRTSPRSWGIPNEIFGSTREVFRPTPAVLIAGHGPPVTMRSVGRGRHGGRGPFPLVTSTPIPTPSSWPNHGPQIQRAQESSHFEYEVMPRIPKPPTLVRVGPPPRLLAPRPIPSQVPTGVPPTLVPVLAEDAIITTSLRPQSRTDRPPPPFLTGPPVGLPPFVTGPPRGPPTFATPSDADFQEGFRILHDLFHEDAGADIRQNLVGGSEVSFNGGFHPPSANANSSASATKDAQPAIQIQPAKEQGILIAGSAPKTEDSSSSEEEKPPTINDQKMQGTELAYGPPHFRPGPPHSYMFGDPHEAPVRYNLYESGYEPGPPPPFHTIGNSILPQQPPPRPPQDPRGPPPPPGQPGSVQQKSPEATYGPPPPPNGNSIQSTPNGPIPMPMMMMPLAPEQTGNEPVPSSEEVQKALGVLARFASKQAQSMGMSASPQMMLQMMRQGPPPNSQYGPPPQAATTQQTEQPNSSTPPGTTYGTPPQQQQQQQSTPIPNFLSLQVTAPPEPSTSGPFGPTTEPAEAFTISASPQESSPFPNYGSPGPVLINGYSGGGGYSSSTGYSSGGGGWGSGGGSGGGGAAELLGAKVNALRTLGSAVTGGLQQVGALKAGILNAGLSVVQGLGHAKGNLANSLKIPIMPNQQPKPVYGPPSTTSTTTTTPSSQYGPPGGGWGPQSSPSGGGGGSPLSAIVNAARGVIGGVVRTAGAGANAAVGIGVSKNEFVKNHFVIKGQTFTDMVSRKINNKNEYFQNVLKHVQNVFDAATKRPQSGWSR